MRAAAGCGFSCWLGWALLVVHSRGRERSFHHGAGHIGAGVVQPQAPQPAALIAR